VYLIDVLVQTLDIFSLIYFQFKFYFSVQIQHQRPSWQSALSFLANNSDPAMALKAPEFMIDTFKKFQPPPDIDLEGGTLLSVEEVTNKD
jgi:hypothetical protein